MRIASAFLVPFVLLAGCGQVEAPADPDAPATVSSRLAEAPALEVHPQRSVGRVFVRFPNTEREATEVVSQAHDGLIVLAADGDDVVIEGLELAFADVVIAPQGAPDALTITGLRLTLDEPVRTDARYFLQRREALIERRATLTQHWTVIFPNGDAVELSPRAIEDVELSIALRVTEDGLLTGELTGTAPELWSPGFVQIDRLEIAASLREP